MDRRQFMKMGLTAGSFLALGTGSHLATRVFGKTAPRKKILVLGFDGMDPHLVDIWMKQGKLPAFEKLRNSGVFTPLQTGNPPQSPVAWSNFITGTNPGGHGIFDFMHRDPENYMFKFSSAESLEAGKTLSLGKYEFPLSGGGISNLRKGKAFWQILEEHDIPATVFKIPSNYPPVPTKQRTLSGMNTPDLYGSYGTCNYYTTAVTELNEDMGGAHLFEVYVIGNQVEARLPGPVNTFIKGSPKPETFIDFKVYIDPVHPVAKIVIQDHEFLLQEGEWSSWKRLKFPLIPTKSVHAICNFYLQQVRPEFKLYVSPPNIDPAAPDLPISTPKSYSRELAEKFGSFYTKGLPADFKALDNNIFNDEEYLAQDTQILEERKAMFEHELANFDAGLLFYYVSSTDQRQHIFWRHIDKNSPSYDPDLADRFQNSIRDVYQEADRMLDTALQAADKETVIMVVSDHGFAPFRRAFNLNTWLWKNGYHRLINERNLADSILFDNTDWSRSQAYAYGLNGLYINQRGREGQGVVNAGAEKENLVQEIIAALESYRDPESGGPAIRKAYRAQDIYSGPHMQDAPDIVVGFELGYRISWESPSGGFTPEIVSDNTAKWSGDHCASPEVVPGIFLMNGKIDREFPSFHDVTPTILKIFGITPPDQMTGVPFAS